MEVTEKLNEARQAGNKEAIASYERQLQQLRELYDLDRKKIEADAESARQQAANNNTSATALPGGTGAAALPSSSGTSARTFNLNLIGVNGRRLDATTTTDPTSFLDEIERGRSVT